MSAKQRRTPEQEAETHNVDGSETMNKRDRNQEEAESVSKIERQRREREERIKALQTADGRKKPIKTRRRRSHKWIGWTVGIVVALAVLAWALNNLGVPQRYLTAAKVGDERISVLEYNYYYGSLVSFYQQSMGGQSIDLDADALYSEEDETWDEFFTRLTETSIQETYILLDKAEQAGYTMSEEGADSVDQYFTDVAAQIGSQFDMQMYLEGTYGPGASPDTLKPILEKQRLASEYSNEIPADYAFTDEEIESRYQEDTTLYDLVDYHQFSLRADTTVAEGETPLTDEQKEERIEEVRELAESALKELDEPEDFEAVADDYRDQLKKLQAESKADEVDAGLEDDDDEEDDVDTTLYENRGKTSIYPTSVATWLYEDDRDANDTEMIEEGEVFYIIQFRERKQDTRPVPDLRFTLFPASLYQGASAAQRSNALAAAEQLEEKIKNEDDLLDIDNGLEDESYVGEVIEVVDEETQEKEEVTVKPDPSMLVEEITLTSGLEQAIAGWAIEADRAVGDITSVQGNYGSYVAVITDIDDEDNQQTYNIRYVLAQEKYRDDMEAWRGESGYQLTQSRPGYWLTN